MNERCDIFCRVVDNFGDVGICWRLARQLASEHHLEVRLWLDDISAFCSIEPSAVRTLAEQTLQSVRVCIWPTEWQNTDVTDLVVEAFGCELPAAYINAMADRANPCLWINLEYLSAEPWVDSHHGLPSLQSNRQEKYFFFPGFTSGSGGLLREAGLIERRREFQADEKAQSAFLHRVGIVPVPGARLMSLFAYENAGLSSWLGALSAGLQPTQLLVPEGRILGDLRGWVNDPGFDRGDSFSRGNLHLSVLPFLSQEDYDHLLWCCDFNVVRGEDSFVRAQWGGRPFLWQPYPQAADIHIEKLEAFLNLYCQGLSPAAGGGLRELSLVWSTGQTMEQAWSLVAHELVELSRQAEAWCDQQAARINISQAVVNFYRNWI